MVSTGHSLGFERTHYAVVAVDSAGLELRGWDFRTLDAAEKHGEQLRLKGLCIEVWFRDELGRKLARLVPGPALDSQAGGTGCAKQDAEIRALYETRGKTWPKLKRKNRRAASTYAIANALAQSLAYASERGFDAGCPGGTRRRE